MVNNTTLSSPDSSAHSDYVVVLDQLYFEYPDGHLALNGFSGQIRKNSITALVGANGSGKTTLLRCIATLETPLSGAISINAWDCASHPREAHQLIGYLPDVYGLYDDLEVGQCLWYAARIRSLSDIQAKSAVCRVLEQLNLTDKVHAKVGGLSHGQRQRVAIAQAIVHSPRLLLLDEPANGLDPDARNSLAELLKRLANEAEGMTILVSSHILAELDQYASDMMIIKAGKLIEQHQLRHIESTEQILMQLTYHTGYQLVPEIISSFTLAFPSCQLQQHANGLEINLQTQQQASEVLRWFCVHDVPVIAYYEKNMLNNSQGYKLSSKYYQSSH